MKGKKGKQTLETKGFFVINIWVFLGKQQQKKEIRKEGRERKEGRKEGKRKGNNGKTDRKKVRERKGKEKRVKKLWKTSFLLSLCVVGQRTTLHF